MRWVARVGEQGRAATLAERSSPSVDNPTCMLPARFHPHPACLTSPHPPPPPPPTLPRQVNIEVETQTQAIVDTVERVLQKYMAEGRLPALPAL